MHVVVIIDQHAFPTAVIEVRGSYPDAAEAERARRRIHLDLALATSGGNRARTYVRQVGQ